ncbi:MAG: hypothetical protein GY710_22685 [Desulfobacteraceae bacterium]|nr:hypothetical protein [Desulfobacteraceae bacterium]
MSQATLEQLKQLTPDQIKIEHPSLEKDWTAHLIWLIENKPRWTQQTFQESRMELWHALMSVVQKASLARAIKKVQGDLTPDQIEKIIYDQIVAPPIIQEVEPMEEKIQEQIMNWSYNLY